MLLKGWKISVTFRTVKCTAKKKKVAAQRPWSFYYLSKFMVQGHNAHSVRTGHTPLETAQSGTFYIA